jgi:putative aminopeptidase FrvX
MDHPGFVVQQRRGRTVWAEFRGGVAAEYFVGSRVRFISAEVEGAGVIRSRQDASDADAFPVCRVELDEPADIQPGMLGMWDVKTFARTGSRVSARACDDLGGVASILCAMEDLVSARLSADVTGMFTRGEEAGFAGALAAASSGQVPADALLVAIETSAAQSRARLGDGVVVRVGDRTLTFEPELTAHIAAVAGKLAADDADFRFVRQLMPGGTCESTAFAAFGLRAAALCIPLGNYHNQGPGGKIRPEQIDAGDFECLVKLLVALAGQKAGPQQTMTLLKKRLQGLLSRRRKLLTDPAACGR